MKKNLCLLLLIVIGGVAYWFGVTHSSTPNGAQPAGFRDGTYLGYVHKIDSSGSTLAFDDAVMLTGKSAQDAAIDAGYCTEANRFECAPNDFFIKNAKIGDEVLQLGDAVIIFMQTWQMEETGEVAMREISLDDFAALINDESLHWRQLPYSITIQNGKIFQIEEVYIP